MKIEKISPKSAPFPLHIFQQDALPVGELNNVRIFDYLPQLVDFGPERGGVDEVSSVIEGKHYPADLSLVAQSKITNRIHEHIAFLRDLFCHLLQLPPAVDNDQLCEIGIRRDAIARHDEMLVVLCKVVAVIVDCIHLLLRSTAQKSSVVMTATVMRIFVGHWN